MIWKEDVGSSLRYQDLTGTNWIQQGHAQTSVDQEQHDAFVPEHSSEVKWLQDLFYPALHKAATRRYL